MKFLRVTELVSNKVNLGSSVQTPAGSFHHTATQLVSPAVGNGHTFPSEQQSAGGKLRVPCPQARDCRSSQLSLWLQERETERNEDKPKQTAPGGADTQLLPASSPWCRSALRPSAPSPQQQPSLRDFHQSPGA